MSEYPYNADNIPGLTFHDEGSGKNMRYIYPDAQHWCAGWLLSQKVDGGWMTVRKATDIDIAAINRAVSEAHHQEPMK
jgi:hypothetical protein